MSRKGKNMPYRTAVQIFFFALVALISLDAALETVNIPVIASASLHAICPFGGIVSIYRFAAVGTFVQKIHESAFALMAIAFVLTLLFGPVICGWVCPLGSFQEWIGKLGRKIFKKRFNRFIPERLDRYLRYLRYIPMIAVIVITATTAKLVFQGYDPYFALFNFWTGEVALTALIVLGVTTVSALFVERPWCKYACPYGALLGIFNLFRIFKIRRKASTCINCKMCDKACPMNIKVTAGSKVTDHQCVSCLKCTSEAACPVPSTVDLAAKGEK